MLGANAIRDWLDGEAWSQTFEDATDDGMLTFANMLKDMGFAPRRIAFGAPILHPLYKASVMFWDAETNEITTEDIPHDWEEDNPDFYLTPIYNIIIGGAYAVRRNYLGTGACLGSRPAPLETDGTTDYVAFRMRFHCLPSPDGAFSMSTDAPEGFTTEQLKIIDDFIPSLTRISEVYMFEELTQTLMQTYLGTTPGQMVMKGQIRRGDGIETRAVILFSDLRDSTRLSMELPRKEYLALLNDYFDCVAGAMIDNGGEVLRYIGDAALAIIPISDTFQDTEACLSAAEAVREAWRRLDILNRKREKDGKEPISFGIGLHVGDVTYGNIGVPERLEFTVIGEAANRAARLQDQTKVFNCPVVVSEEFKIAHGGAWRYLGEMSIRIADTTIPVYTIRSENAVNVPKPPGMSSF